MRLNVVVCLACEIYACGLVFGHPKPLDRAAVGLRTTARLSASGFTIEPNSP